MVNLPGIVKFMIKYVIFLLIVTYGYVFWMSRFVYNDGLAPVKPYYCSLIRQQDWCAKAGCNVSIGATTITEIGPEMRWQCTE